MTKGQYESFEKREHINQELSDLAEFIDSSAENENFHDWNGVASAIADAVSEVAGSEAALKVLKMLVKNDTFPFALAEDS